MRSAVLADSGPLYAAVDLDDAYHPQAQRELKRLARTHFHHQDTKTPRKTASEFQCLSWWLGVLVVMKLELRKRLRHGGTPISPL